MNATPCEMLLYRVHIFRRDCYMGTSVALIRADNEQSWLDHWSQVREGLSYRVELVERHPAP